MCPKAVRCTGGWISIPSLHWKQTFKPTQKVNTCSWQSTQLYLAPLTPDIYKTRHFFTGKVNTALTPKGTPRWRVVTAQQSYTWTLNPHTRRGETQTTHSSVYDFMFITQSQGLGMSRMLPNQNQTKQMNTWLQEEGLDWRLGRKEKEKEKKKKNILKWIERMLEEKMENWKRLTGHWRHKQNSAAVGSTVRN